MNTTSSIKERPLLYSGEMVRAILSGCKTQTRRLFKTGPCGFATEDLRCPHGNVGDRLWVRERFSTSLSRVDYLADDSTGLAGANLKMQGRPYWRPSIHMPRWASRITLEITQVHHEPVQSITAKDAMAEGVTECAKARGVISFDPREEFALLWDRINSERGYPWADNPWVWVITFRRIDQVGGHRG